MLHEYPKFLMGTSPRMKDKLPPSFDFSLHWVFKTVTTSFREKNKTGQWILPPSIGFPNITPRLLRLAFDNVSLCPASEITSLQDVRER